MPRFIDQNYREEWFASLAYLTFCDRVKPRTLLCKVRRSTSRHTSHDKFGAAPNQPTNQTPAYPTNPQQLADKDAAVGLFIVTLQRFDVGDGRGGFAIVHRLEPAPESRCVRVWESAIVSIRRDVCDCAGGRVAAGLFLSAPLSYTRHTTPTSFAVRQVRERPPEPKPGPHLHAFPAAARGVRGTAAEPRAPVSAETGEGGGGVVGCG